MPFGRSAIESNDIALFMLQQRRRMNRFHFALRHAATCGSRAHVYLRVGIAWLSATGARVPSLAFLTCKQQLTMLVAHIIRATPQRSDISPA
jgi:hypothetical protein